MRQCAFLNGHHEEAVEVAAQGTRRGVLELATWTVRLQICLDKIKRKCYFITD